MRMNFETGKREAKLMAGDSGIKYWNSGEKQGTCNPKIFLILCIQFFLCMNFQFMR